MTPFRTFASPAASMPQANIDTDIIFPARFLTITEKRGLGQFAFHDRPDLNVVQGTEILIVGDNFGCGSSREQAPWSLADIGIRAIFAHGFGEIFWANCFKNSILAVTLPADQIDRLHQAARAGELFTIDLEAQQIRLQQTGIFPFDIAPVHREALLEGLDEIEGIRTRCAPAIGVFEAAQRQTSPWLWTHEHG